MNKNVFNCWDSIWNHVSRLLGKTTPFNLGFREIFLFYFWKMKVIGFWESCHFTVTFLFVWILLESNQCQTIFIFKREYCFCIFCFPGDICLKVHTHTSKRSYSPCLLFSKNKKQIQASMNLMFGKLKKNCPCFMYSYHYCKILLSHLHKIG